MWYTVTWFDISGDQITQELIHRNSPEKVLEFCKNRFQYNRAPKHAYGFWFSESERNETFDYDFDPPEPHVPSAHAVDIGEREDGYPKVVLAETVEPWVATMVVET